MEFVKVERNDLIKQFQEYIELLKKCPNNMEFHVLVEFCGIDKTFLNIAEAYNKNKMIQAAKKEQKDNL